MKIVCNNVPRNLIYGYELSTKERGEFDYIESEEFELHEFFRCKGSIYDTGEFMRIDSAIAPHPQREGWENFDGYASDSFFSGVLVKYVDSDHVIVATYFC